MLLEENAGDGCDATNLQRICLELLFVFAHLVMIFDDRSNDRKLGHLSTDHFSSDG